MSDNARLISLLDTYSGSQTPDNYKLVMDELLNGSSFLLMPSGNNNKPAAGWETVDRDTKLSISSIFVLDGLKVLGAFTDETSLANWIKKETEYIALGTQDLMELCKVNGIERLVINSGGRNMFVLERDRGNITDRSIEQETKVLVGAAAKPLPAATIERLAENFRKVNTIEEGYQYLQSVNNETSYVIGCKMTVVSDNSKAALYNAVNSSLTDGDLDIPIDIMILETEEWLKTVRNIPGAQFYRQSPQE
ncbi:MAG: hypothetical protein EOO09_03330 [Chitinophagaceae bacterium]|nr:MAG: hypothetical protein EOO09_03330 [Chitinophagaceae bacterium]